MQVFWRPAGLLLPLIVPSLKGELREMSKIVAVLSGKGGVGKSTVAVNLACAMAKQGHAVALVDCDFYGPSVPTLLGGGEVIPDSEGKLVPPMKYGVKYISIGFFLKHPDDPIIWRGPMFHNAMSQMIRDTRWGEVEYFIIDMPPGTGDAQISLSQNFSLSGAVVVTTPQEVALADVRKCINMLTKVNVPLLGIVENMAGFKSADGTHYDIFGSGGGKSLAEKLNVPLLASIPIEIAIREGGDLGRPASTDEKSPAVAIFDNLATGVLEAVLKVESARPVLNVVN